jgi:hypothetical protein
LFDDASNVLSFPVEGASSRQSASMVRPHAVLLLAQLERDQRVLKKLIKRNRKAQAALALIVGVMAE